MTMFQLAIFSSALTLALSFSTTTQAQNNLDRLLTKVEEGKTYALLKSHAGTANTVDEKHGYYIKLVPPKYRTVHDTIVISPALNGNLDTSNYFIQTEVLVLREPSLEWKLAKVSRLCMEDTKHEPHAAICLLKTVPQYDIVHRHFYPFKNITDTTNTDYIIPAKIKIVARQELVEPTRLYHIPLNQKVELADNEYLITVPAGTWKEWDEVVCPFGVFNDPDIRQVQLALQKQGYSIKITNSYDEQTKRMLHQFQLDNMLPEGEMDDTTLKRLGVERQRLIQVIDNN